MTMIRTLLCTVLLSAACQANAGTLYRWAEPDGSLTFSPAPPAAGIAYDTVETGGDNLATQSGLSADQNLAQSSAPASTASVSTPISVAAAPQAEPQIKISAVPETLLEPATSTPQGLAYAPNTADELPQGITRGDQVVAATPSAATPNRDGVVASSKKFEQCQELQKRVVSLERRLRSKLSPDDVDNTVVAIVRYQSSYDTHCD